jgi:hypothetical protein
MWKCALLLTSFLLITSCVSQAANSAPLTPSSVAHFPQQMNTPNAYMEALIKGELVLVNGCLRVNDIEGDSILLIWRPGFSARMEQGVVQVVDSTRQVAASVGDFVAVSGGFDDDPTWMTLTEPLPQDCPGPYFIVGESIKKLDQRPSLQDIYFPQLAVPLGNTDFLVRGELTIENGCLRVSKANLATGDSFLLIWDLNFASRKEQGVVQVIDSNTGEVLASVGDYVEVGGGLAPSDVEKYLKEPIPNECSGPYWLVGEMLKKIDYP